MTEDMSVNVKEQGEAIGKIEDHIVQVNNNVKAGEREIDEAERITRRNTKRLLWIFLLICFVVVSIVGVLLAILLPGDDNNDNK
jgi:t-SNARE complex subunit (syntaxin)